MISALVITRSSAPFSASRVARGTLAHAVANHFAAAEGDLVAVDGEVLLDFDDQFGIGQPDAIALGGAVKVGVGAARNSTLMLRLRTVRIERSIHLAVVAVYRAHAAERHQRDFFFLAGLKADRRARGNIQTHAVRGAPIEIQRAVDFEEVIVAADLNRAGRRCCAPPRAPSARPAFNSRSSSRRRRGNILRDACGLLTESDRAP